MAAAKQTDNAVLFYQNRAADYDYTWHPSFARRFESHLNITAGQRVLDLACGTGLLTFLEADRVGPTGTVVGIDITPNMLAQAQAKKERAGSKYSNLQFYRGDILDLDAIDALKDQTFDAITVASALVLLPDPKAAVQYWTKFLKPNGTIALDSTHPKNLVSGMVFERTGRRLGLPMPYNRTWSTSEDSLREVLESAGLEVEKVVTIEDQAGYGTKYHDQAEWDDHFVEKVIMGDTTRTFADSEIRRKARDIFKEEWGKLAVDGRVEEVDSVFLGIARRTENFHKRKALFETDRKGDKEVVLTGGCRCGSVRYTSTSLPDSITCCHCRACQQLSGSAFLPFLEVPTSSLVFSSPSSSATGEATSFKTLRLSDAAERTCCTECGTPLTMVYNSDRDSTSLTAGSIDIETFKGEWPKVTKHIFLKEKAAWFMLPDDGAQRKDTANVPGEVVPKPI
jgi:ubiquinone/menaquinone biosynthesis C-methylase UbiE